MPSTPAIHGVLPVVQMPFTDDDRIDWATLEAEVHHVFSAGVHGITLALVSELMRLTHEERVALTRSLPTLAAGRGPVIISVGAEITQKAVEYAVLAEEAGAHAVMAMPPVGTPLPPEAVFDYYRAIHDAVALPLIVQDPAYAGRTLTVAQQVRLRQELGPRICFKPEAIPVGPTISALQAALENEAVIYEGSGGLSIIDAFRRGASGTMPGCDLVGAFVPLWRALTDGDEARAYEIYERICPLTVQQIASVDMFLAVEKHLLVQQGIFKNERVRQPTSYTLDEVTAAEIDRLYDRLQARLADHST